MTECFNLLPFKAQRFTYFIRKILLEFGLGWCGKCFTVKPIDEMSKRDFGSNHSRRCKECISKTRLVYYYSKTAKKEDPSA